MPNTRSSVDVSMDAERVLRQTVLVDGPLDGRGKFLMPGVSEMHGHYPNPEAREFTEAVLFMYIANGVTLVRGMQGGEAHLQLRDAIEAGEIVGPRLLVSAPSLSGNSVETVERAEQIVRDAAEAGFDHLKVHEG